MNLCIGVTENCKNPESYGTICVRCNQCGRFDKPKQTNADRIRAMSDEELQKFLLEFEAGDIDYAKTFCDMCCKDAALERKSTDCDGCLLWWLKHGAEQPQGLEYWNRRSQHEH